MLYACPKSGLGSHIIFLAPAPDFFSKRLWLLISFPGSSSSWIFFSSGSGFWIFFGSDSSSKGSKICGSLWLCGSPVLTKILEYLLFTFQKLYFFPDLVHCAVNHYYVNFILEQSIAHGIHSLTLNMVCSSINRLTKSILVHKIVFFLNDVDSLEAKKCKAP